MSGLRQQHILPKSIRKRLWFHCASAGEYEQAIPIIQKMKSKKDIELVISFFSASGMDYYKLHPLADAAYYLPFDTPNDVASFLDKLQPDAVIWVKYEFWFNILHQLQSRRIPLILINADLNYLSKKGGFAGRVIRKCLIFFDKVFAVSPSAELSAICKDVEVGFDTKWMKALENTRSPFNLPAIEQWKGDSKCCIAGSTHLEDIHLLAMAYGSAHKWMIVPHEPEGYVIKAIQKAFQGKKVALLSDNQLGSSEILIIDKKGILKWLYRYADLAYIGGGFGKSVHNVLEAAAYEIPVYCGPNVGGIPETQTLIDTGLLHIIHDAEELSEFIHQHTTIDNNTFKTNSKLLFEKAVSQNSTALISGYIQSRMIS